ncbi:MAG: sulfatase-like hydrolase/transferase, partial [Planctomycetota bacterium]
MRFVLSLLFVVASSSFAAETRPNIVFILADDLGWAELGCYGNEFNETPHIDRLAREGLRHTQAYAAAPVCSPYRAALITGKYPVRVGILDYLRPNSNAGLAAKHGSVATELKKAGYVTGMIGKWHLSGYRYHGSTHEVRPTDRGFDWEVAAEVKSVGNGANFWP